MNGYSQTFTLEELLTDEHLKGILPRITYKESWNAETGKQSQRVGLPNMERLVMQTIQPLASIYYKPLKAKIMNDNIEIGGTLKLEYKYAYNGIYNVLVANKSNLEYLLSNFDILRDAVKENEKVGWFERGSKRPKLYLTFNSMTQIQKTCKGTDVESQKNKEQLIKEIMENIYYGSGFRETQKKWGLNQTTRFGKTYEQLRSNWARRVGENE